MTVKIEMDMPKSCDKCPLRRNIITFDGTVRNGLCWFILMNGFTEELLSCSLFARAEKTILEQQEVSYPKEWEEWLNKRNK